MENTAPRYFQAHHGDYVVLAIFNTPTEAYIVKGCLEAAGIHAVIADDHLVQADSLLTVALGGVRLRVQEKNLGAARQVLVDFDRGAFVLEEAEADAEPANHNHADGNSHSADTADTADTADFTDVTRAPLALPGMTVWSPDNAAFWSLLFTPIFGSVLHVFNATRLGQTRLLYNALFWLAINTYCTNYIVWHTAKGDNLLETLLNQVSTLLPLMIVWYLLGVRPQSRYVIRHVNAHIAPPLRWLIIGIGLVLTLIRLQSWPPA